ncbi:MAG: hypothetical protein ACYTEQ_22510 [Planctomycetota bacterium]|jgi:hypothetical protein
MARNNVAKKVVSEDRSKVSFEFTHGEALACSLADLPEEIRDELVIHGVKQKVGDSYCSVTDPAEAMVHAAKVWERLIAGDWKVAREGGGGQRITDLVKALSNVTGKELEECIDVVDGLEKAQKSALRKHAQIAAELAKISAERAAEKAEAAADAPPLDLNAL